MFHWIEGSVAGALPLPVRGGSARHLSGHDEIDPIVMLFWTAVINGVVAVPIMIAIMIVISGAEGLKKFPLPRCLMAVTLILFIWSNVT